MPDRPSILYIFTDQQCADALSCAGNADVSTPAMDSLAETGVRFESAYCTYPLCTPSRASMFTGLMPHQVGVYANDVPIHESLRQRELGHLLSIRSGIGLALHGRMVRTPRYKYVMYSAGKHREQLFHMHDDPGEMVNLAVEARYRDVLGEHRRLLAEWIEETDDRFEAHYAHPHALAQVPGQEYR